MQTLTANEARVLGVLIEKAQTTPGQYPMTINSIVNGCNQKSNREPVMNLDEDHVFDALDTLRQKHFVREVDMTGSRVAKFRHITRDTLSIDTHQLVVLAELMLRGPQTMGEIRGRASRMNPIENLEAAEAIVDSLMKLDPPLISKQPAPAGSRAPIYIQLLAPGIHNVQQSSASSASAPTTPREGTQASTSTTPNAFEDRIAALERRVGELAERLSRLEE